MRVEASAMLARSAEAAMKTEIPVISRAFAKGCVQTAFTTNQVDQGSFTRKRKKTRLGGNEE